MQLHIELVLQALLTDSWSGLNTTFSASPN
jgi:hypothetical protein